MRFSPRFAICLLSAVVASSIATTALTAPAQPQTRVETDQKTGAIRFFVNGTEQARIDGNGMHVRQGVEYGGTLTDTGSRYYERGVHVR